MTIETKISANGTANVYVDGKKTSNDKAFAIAWDNGLPIYDASCHTYTGKFISKSFASPISAYRWLLSKANTNNNFADGSWEIQEVDKINGRRTTIYENMERAFAVNNTELEAYILTLDNADTEEIKAIIAKAAKYVKEESYKLTPEYAREQEERAAKAKAEAEREAIWNASKYLAEKIALDSKSVNDNFEYCIYNFIGKEVQNALADSDDDNTDVFDLLPTADELNDVEIDDEAKTDEPETTDETDEDAHNTTEKIEVAIGANAMPAMIDLFEPNKITLNTPAQILKLIEDAAGNSFSFDYESYFINTDDDTRHKFITRHFVSECKNYSFIEIFTDDGKLDCVEFLKHFLAGYKEVKFYLAAPAQDNVDVDRELVNSGIDNFKQANELTAKLLKATETAGYKSVTCQDGLTILAHFKGAKVTSDDDGYDILTAWDRLLGHYDTPAQVTAVINRIKACVDANVYEFTFPTTVALKAIDIEAEALNTKWKNAQLQLDKRITVVYNARKGGETQWQSDLRNTDSSFNSLQTARPRRRVTTTSTSTTTRPRRKKTFSKFFSKANRALAACTTS